MSKSHGLELRREKAIRHAAENAPSKTATIGGFRHVLPVCAHCGSDRAIQRLVPTCCDGSMPVSRPQDELTTFAED